MNKVLSSSQVVKKKKKDKIFKKKRDDSVVMSTGCFSRGHGFGSQDPACTWFTYIPVGKTLIHKNINKNKY